MRFQDLHFSVNGRRIGPTAILGAQPDLDFFEQAQEYLEGTCVVTFRVGDQVVTNRVTLHGTDLRVENDFVPYDIRGFIEGEKARVRREQEAAGFVDDPTDIYFVPARTILACDRLFPVFDRSRLVRDPPGPRYFVSHSWQSPAHPDPRGEHLALLKRYAAREADAHFWIDYSCLPQKPRSAEDEAFFRRTLPRIASIQSGASTLVIADARYGSRMWCHMEHFTGVLFSLAHEDDLSGVEYAGPEFPDPSIVDQVQRVEEPAWDVLEVTDPADVPGIRYNYRWLSNLAQFQLYDRFNELRRALPGHEIYSGTHYFQSAFGLRYGESLENVRNLFLEFGGDLQFFFKENSLLWLARRFSWSVFPDDYRIEDFRFSPYLLHSEEIVGWMALLLGIIRTVNPASDQIVNLREMYAQIVLISLFR